MHIQLLEAERAPWLKEGSHNNTHLLRVASHVRPVLLAVKASLKDLAAYSNDFVPPDTLEQLTTYLLSWTSAIALFRMLTAE